MCGYSNLTMAKNNTKCYWVEANVSFYFENLINCSNLTDKLLIEVQMLGPEQQAWFPNPVTNSVLVCITICHPFL